MIIDLKASSLKLSNQHKGLRRVFCEDYILDLGIPSARGGSFVRVEIDSLYFEVLHALIIPCYNLACVEISFEN